MKISKNVSVCAMLVALAMICSYVENMIPVNFGIPGVKLGLANLVTITALYLIPPWEVLAIVITRILLMGFMFGNGMSILYSLAGGILSFTVMLLMRKAKGFSIIGVSIAGGILHNVGQIFVAVCVVENLKLIYYLPVLLISGTITGALIGMIAGRIQHIIRRQAFETIGKV